MLSLNLPVEIQVLAVCKEDHPNTIAASLKECPKTLPNIFT